MNVSHAAPQRRPCDVAIHDENFSTESLPSCELNSRSSQLPAPRRFCKGTRPARGLPHNRNLDAVAVHRAAVGHLIAESESANWKASDQFGWGNPADLLWSASSCALNVFDPTLVLLICTPLSFRYHMTYRYSVNFLKKIERAKCKHVFLHWTMQGTWLLSNSQSICTYLHFLITDISLTYP